MQINNTTDQELSLYHDALYWADVSSTLYPFDPDFVRNANFALDKVAAYIMRFDSSWEWHDQNRTTLPIADGDLVSGQADYALTLSHLKVLRVRVKDSNGNYHTLKPIQRRSLSDDELAAEGVPEGYDKLGGSLFLYPKPNYGVTAGIEIQFQTIPSYFTTSDTAKEPGFAPQFHRLISLYAALDYAKVNGLTTRVKLIQEEIGYCPEPGRSGLGLLGELCAFYSQRDYDEAPRMLLAKSNRGISLL